MTLASIPATKLKALIATFIGMHVPLVTLAIYGMATGLRALIPVLVVTLLATLAGVVGTVFALMQILQDDELAGPDYMKTSADFRLSDA